MQSISMLTSLKRSKDILYIFILALVVALVWIVLGVYHAAVKNTIPPNILKLTLPLTPTVDTELLQTLSSRTMFTDEQLANFPINRLIIKADGTEEEVSLPIATPTPTPVGTASASVNSGSTASASATPTPTPTATPATTQ